ASARSTSSEETRKLREFVDATTTSASASAEATSPRASGSASSLRATLARRSSPRFATKAILDRKSTRLNSSHQIISYAAFCLTKKIRAVSAVWKHTHRSVTSMMRSYLFLVGQQQAHRVLHTLLTRQQ